MAQPVKLIDFAKQAFREGKNEDGFRYLYAHYLCNDSEGDELKDKVKWSSALKRPALAVRFGIGITYMPKAGYAGDPYPIGRDQPQQAGGGGGFGGAPGFGGGEGGRRGRGRGGAGAGMPGMPGAPGAGAPGMPGMPGMGGGGGAGGAPSDGRGIVDYYTGEFGTKIVEALESRIQDGSFGEILLDFDGPAASAGGDGGFGGMPGMPGGMPGAPVGAGGPGMMPPGAGAPGLPGAPGAAGGAVGKASDPKGIAPAITFVGTGVRESLERKARTEGIDVLFVFDVSVSQSLKTNIVGNQTQLKIYSLHKPETLFTSALLNSITVSKEREKGKEKDPLETQIDNAMSVIDKAYKLEDFPQGLTPEAAQRRVLTISSSGDEDRALQNLVEARFFKAARLITNQQYADAAKGLIGGERAETLLKAGKEEDRRPALARFLPGKGGRR